MAERVTEAWTNLAAVSQRTAESLTLWAALELGLFTAIGDESVSLAEAGMLLEIEPRPARVLLTACTALGWLFKENDSYWVSPTYDEYLIADKPNYRGPILTFGSHLESASLRQVMDALVSNQPQTWEGYPSLYYYLDAHPQQQQEFFAGLQQRSLAAAAYASEVFDFGQFQRMLDVGGGWGGYTISLTGIFPELRATVFDRPSTVTVARQKIEEAGVADRVSVSAGDFFEDDLPKGFDGVLLSRILCDRPLNENLPLLRKVFEGLPIDGRVVTSDLMLHNDLTGPLPVALNSLTLLRDTEGQNYTWAEYNNLLTEVGFRNIQF